MKKTKLFLKLFIALFILTILNAGNAFADYPVVEIKNLTDFDFSAGFVSYASEFCKNDPFSIKAGKTWKAKSRGVCLVTGITLGPGMKKKEVKVPVKYSSSGTSYSKFYIAAFQDELHVMSEAEYKGDGTGYPVVNIENYNDFGVSGTVKYMSAFCKDDDFKISPAKIDPKNKDKRIPSTWRAKSRGVCLVEKIESKCSSGCKDTKGMSKADVAKHGILPYVSTGTSYSKYAIRGSDVGYKVYSEEMWKSKLANDKRKDFKSPGFYITNKTEWPVMITLDQVGCLYHEVIPPGKSFIRDTGAVWFTINANVVAWDNMEEKSDWECVEPVAKLVLDVASIVSGAGPLSKMMGSVTGALTVSSAKVMLKKLAKAVIMDEIKDATSDDFKKGFLAKIPGESEKDREERIAKTIDILLKAQVALKVEFEKTKPLREASIKGQYAGYEWPFRCDKMPTYEIIGGPDKDSVTMFEGKTLKIKKTNTCGNDFM